MFGVGNFVSASTIPFDITVTAYGPSNPDPYSYREMMNKNTTLGLRAWIMKGDYLLLSLVLLMGQWTQELQVIIIEN